MLIATTTTHRDNLILLCVKCQAGFDTACPKKSLTAAKGGAETRPDAGGISRQLLVQHSCSKSLPIEFFERTFPMCLRNHHRAGQRRADWPQRRDKTTPGGPIILVVKAGAH